MDTKHKRVDGAQRAERASNRASHAIPGMVALLALLVGLASSANAQTGQVAPAPKFLAFDASGNPCSSCRLYAYLAGTTTPTDTYTSSTLGTPNTNPVVLDSAGRATVFINPSIAMKFTLKTAADVDIYTVDNVVGPFAGVISATAANTRGIQISRASADAGMSIASTGGSGKTYGIVSTTTGTLVIRDDADGTPNITISGNDVTTTATGTVATVGNQTVSGTLAVTGLVTGSANMLTQSTGPIYTLIETDGAADNKRWAVAANGEAMTLQAVNDAASVGTVFFQADRTGTTVDSITLSPTAILNTGRYNSATLQPGFLAYNSATDTTVAAGVNLDFDTEVYDHANNFAADTFTAPVTGTYHFCVGARIKGTVGSAPTYSEMVLHLVASNRTLVIAGGAADSATDMEVTIQRLSNCAYVDMDAADTVSIQGGWTTGAASVTVYGQASPMWTWFSGRLVP